MILKQLRAWLGAAPRVYQISDQANWSLYWDGHYLTHYLRQNHGVNAQHVGAIGQVRHQVLQFVDRYPYLHGKFKEVHPSNTVFLTWYHGDLNDPNPDIQQLFDQLPHALPHLEGIVTSCQTSQQVLIDMGIPAAKIHLIPIGIDLRHFAPPTPAQRAHIREKLGIPPDALCIGSFQKDGQGWGEGMEAKPVKGPDIFLAVIAELAKSYPNLLVFLTGPARGYVKQGLEAIGVKYIHQYLENYLDIAPCYHALDLYLITSRSEGGPKALMESWATGIPLVSTQMGMPADWIQHGQNGMLAAVEDSQGLAAAARELIENPALADRCRQGGLTAVPALDWAGIAAQHYALYEPFLKRR